AHLIAAVAAGATSVASAPAGGRPRSLDSGSRASAPTKRPQRWQERRAWPLLSAHRLAPADGLQSKGGATPVAPPALAGAAGPWGCRGSAESNLRFVEPGLKTGGCSGLRARAGTILCPHAAPGSVSIHDGVTLGQAPDGLLLAALGSGRAPAVPVHRVAPPD